MIEFLKQTFGDAVTEEVITQFKGELGKKFVAKADYNTKRDELKDARETIEELQKSALECGKPEIAQNASRLMEQVSFQRSFSEYMMQMEEEYHYRTNLQKKKAGQ
jgi:hypothetical protein